MPDNRSVMPDVPFVMSDSRSVMSDLTWDLLSKFLVPVPGGRLLAPQGAWEMLRSPAVLRWTRCQDFGGIIPFSQSVT